MQTNQKNLAVPLDEFVEQCKTAYIEKIFKMTDNLDQTADLLKIDPFTVYRYANKKKFLKCSDRRNEKFLPLKDYLHRCESQYLQETLEHFHGNIPQTAKKLNIGRMRVYKHIYQRELDKHLNITNTKTGKELLKWRVYQVRSLKAGQLFIFFGLPVCRKYFWRKHGHEIEYLYKQAKKNYLKMVKQHHPDTNHSADESVLVEINNNWAKLKMILYRRGIKID